MSYNNENLNSNQGENRSEIKKLQSEIDHLNIQIMDKISSIITIDTETVDKNKVINTLKDIVLSQREEINWKNEDIKKLELNIIDLVETITLTKGTDTIVDSPVNIVEDANGKIGELNTAIEELKKKNADNQEIINKLHEESKSEFWEDKISELNKIIIDLTDENASLRNNLENTPIISNKEQTDDEILAYKQQIAELKEENKKAEEKNRMLKAALLMTVDTETKNVADSPETLTEDSVIDVSTSEDKKVFIFEGPSGVQTSKESSDPSERKRKCPNCGASGAFILEIDDKSTIIYQDMGSKIYGKKYKCGDCRHEWK